MQSVLFLSIGMPFGNVNTDFANISCPPCFIYELLAFFGGIFYTDIKHLGGGFLSMKAALIQPEYSKDFSRAEELFEAEVSLLGSCDDSLDIIVMPEYGDIPAMPNSNEDFWASVGSFHGRLLEKAAQTAKRCKSLVFANGIGDKRNTTYAFDRNGDIFGKYCKRHLTEGEVSTRGLSREYALHASAPYITEHEGLRFAFLTCYDFYFYEAFSNIARFGADIIIGCSHQRSDNHETSELFSRFAAYNCNAYLLRASVSMGENSDEGGASMAVAPNGKVLLNMRSRIGIETVEFEPKKKFYKPAGFGNPPSAHYEYVERGRCPWNYRPGGSAIVLPDSVMPYPRLCARTAASQRLLPAFGAAAALDVNEITFEVKCGDNGEIKAFPLYCPNAKIPDSFSEILRKLSCHVVMNILINEEDVSLIRETVSLIKDYDCEKYVYFSSENVGVIRLISEIAEQFPLCLCTDTFDENAVETAFSLGCKKILFSESGYSPRNIELAHGRGLLCNMVLNGGQSDIKRYIASGVDTIITDDCISAIPLFRV